MVKIYISFFFQFSVPLPSLKLTYHLEIDGCKTIVSFWDGFLAGAILVSGRVRVSSLTACFARSAIEASFFSPGARMADEAKVEEKDNFDVGPLSGPR